jgi:chemotaxis signal transduction protein
MASARLIDDGQGGRLALPVLCTLELIDAPRVVSVPGGSPHARGLLQWQGRWLPLVDLGAPSAARYALVVALGGSADGMARHGAIALSNLPRTIEVRDEQACALPADSAWQHCALACFRHGDEAVPVLDPRRVFAAGAKKFRGLPGTL